MIGSFLFYFLYLVVLYYLLPTLVYNYPLSSSSGFGQIKGFTARISVLDVLSVGMGYLLSYECEMRIYVYINCNTKVNGSGDGFFFFWSSLLGGGLKFVISCTGTSSCRGELVLWVQPLTARYPYTGKTGIQESYHGRKGEKVDPTRWLTSPGANEVMSTSTDTAQPKSARPISISPDGTEDTKLYVR